MPSRLRVADHPVHPALVHLPIGLWFAVIAWNGAAWLRPDPLWWQLGYWCLALGLLSAVPAIVAGFLDYVALAPEEPVDAATAHMLVMLCATAAFATAWLLRARTGAALTPPVWALVSELAGVLLLAVGGWLGGTLVYRHGVGGAGKPTTVAKPK